MLAPHRSIRSSKSISKSPVSFAFILLACAHAAQAQSADPAPPMFSFSGFGTVGVAHSTEDRADFIAHDLQATGAGYGRSWSPDVDSRIGAQVTAQFTPAVSAALQVVAEQRHDATYRPAVEWANLKYEFTPDFSVRVGRIRLSSFLASDYQKVGYAQPWVRPPVEVYSLVPLTHNDGVDLSYRLRLGEVTHTLQTAFGETSASVPGGGKAIAKDGWQVSDTVEYGAASLRLSYSRAKFTLEPFKPLFDGYRTFAQTAAGTAAGLPPPPHPASALASGLVQAAGQAAAIADKYDPDNKSFNFISIGGTYDPGDWFVMGEWGQTDTRSVFGKRSAWYATSGYRIGNFTPYVSYAEAKLKSNKHDSGITAVPGDPALADLQSFATSLNANLNEQLAGAPVQKTISLGVRWDFARNTALKLQYDHSRIGDGSPGTLDHQQPGFEPGGRFNVFSATVDFVF